MKTYQYYWELIKFYPKAYLTDIVNISLHFIFMTLFGLIARAFFNHLTGVPGFTLTGFQAAAGQLLSTFLVMGSLFIAMLAFVNFTQYSISLLIRNMLAGILKRPGGDPLPRDKEGITLSTGKLISTFRDDSDDAVRSLIYLDDVVGLSITTLIAFTIMFRISVRVTLGTFIPLTLIIIFANYLAKIARQYRERSRAATAEVTGMIGDMFTATQAIKVAHAEKRIIDRFRALNKKRQTAMIWDQLLVHLVRTLTDGTLDIGIGLLLLLAAEAMFSGEFTIGDFALFVAYLWPSLELIRQGADLITKYRQIGVSFARMESVMQEKEPGSVVAHHPIHMEGDLPPIRTAVKTESDQLKQLVVKNLSYHYPTDDQAGIEQINITLKKGSFTVVTGRIGSGKTTLIETLLGLRTAEQGELIWNGTLVTDPALFMTPPRVAYTSQVPQLFSDTVRNNILLGNDIAESIVGRALATAVLTEDIAQMSDQLETKVGPRGIRLSGGQIQRTAAARMFATNAELFVFDDLSSALDIETEQKLWDNLLLTKDSDPPTCLVVSHRRPALKRADQIILLQDGKIIDQGNLTELLERSEEMRALWVTELDQPNQ